MVRSRIPSEIERRVRADAGNRCGYCLTPQHLTAARLHVEHIIPLGKQGTSDESNLWLACPLCNGHKSNKTTAADPQSGESVPLFNPRTQSWAEHFQWSDNGLRVVGISPIGRATVSALHLADDPDALLARSYWIMAGWHPPAE